jgi:hypothetical protein
MGGGVTAFNEARRACTLTRGGTAERAEVPLVRLGGELGLEIGVVRFGTGEVRVVGAGGETILAVLLDSGGCYWETGVQETRPSARMLPGARRFLG